MKTIRFISILSVVPFMMAIVSALHALEVDEKLTMRILRVSESQKTILINRGLEDGLTIDQHAKFFLTTGVVARGVLVKASPARSVWALYRLVDATQIQEQRVLSLKITPPMKITSDGSKAVYADEHDPVFDADQSESMSLNDSPQDQELAENDDLGQVENRKTELAAFTSRHARSGTPDFGPLDESHRSLGQKTTNFSSFTLLEQKMTWELWSQIGFSQSQNQIESTAESFSGQQNYMQLAGGIEKYFTDGPRSWARRISFTAFAQYYALEHLSIRNNRPSSSITEFGVGGYLHFLHDPFVAFVPIFFVGGSMGLGTSHISDLEVDGTGAAALVESDGTTNFFTLAFGMKYLFQHGLGTKMMLEYYHRNESYVEENSTWTLKASGPRILWGLSYRL